MSILSSFNDYMLRAVSTRSEEAMKYLCLAYLDEKNLDTMAESEREMFRL